MRIWMCNRVRNEPFATLLSAIENVLKMPNVFTTGQVTGLRKLTGLDPFLNCSLWPAISVEKVLVADKLR